MKLSTLFCSLFSIISFAQDPCEISSNVTDSLGTYKSTKDYLMHERNFAGTASQMFFSIALTDGMPTLNLTHIQKSKDFIQARCLDKNSRIYLQLTNGKIITLRHIDQENCGTMVRDDNGFSNRILSCFFLFMKDTFEDLKTSDVSIMRIKYTTETVDYIVKDELKPETGGLIYHPANYFVKVLKCLDH